MYHSNKRANAQKIERTARARENENLRHNTACLYKWACVMMGIDPDNNPNLLYEYQIRRGYDS